MRPHPPAHAYGCGWARLGTHDRACGDMGHSVRDCCRVGQTGGDHVMSRLALRVQPGAKRTALVARLASGEWKVAVSAPPVDGRANDAVVDLLSRLLAVKRSQVTLVRGSSARSKVVE